MKSWRLLRNTSDGAFPFQLSSWTFFHWPNQGDWKFDRRYWPDPAKMVRELKEMGIEVMVSIWPTVEQDSENYEEMRRLGYLVRSEAGKRLGQLGNACFVDMTNPDARAYVWNKIKENYYDCGIRIFWLDEAEPEFTDYEYDHYRYHLGSVLEVGNLYPKLYARMAYEGMTAEGQENVINLLRCAWAGSQRYGALVWSGDIDSSFRSLRNQLVAGLNMGLAGIPWWTTDIGGFHGGNIHCDKFKEVLVRWFQFGAFCPVFRLHGFREPVKEPIGKTGGGMMPSGAITKSGPTEKKCTKSARNTWKSGKRSDPILRPLCRRPTRKALRSCGPYFMSSPRMKRPGRLRINTCSAAICWSVPFCMKVCGSGKYICRSAIGETSMTTKYMKAAE